MIAWIFTFCLLSLNLSLEHYCQEYLNLDQCFLCYHTYFNPKNHSCQIPHVSIPNCKYYKDAEKCKTCEGGFEINKQQNKCIKCRNDACLQCSINPSGDQNCLVCVDKDADQCKKYQPSLIKNCRVIAYDVIKDLYYCQECQEGYNIEFFDVNCVKETEETRGCWLMSRGVCRVCKDGYYIEKNTHKCFKIGEANKVYSY